MSPKEQKIDPDAEHVVLYRSPGSERGGNGRTYDWKHARDEDEKAGLLADGYHLDLLDAYAAAGKPVLPHQLAPSLRPAKVAPEAPKAAAPEAPKAAAPEAPKAAAPAPKGEKDEPAKGEAAGTGPTLADVRTALKALKAAKDQKAVTALLKPFDATTSDELEEAQYADVIAAAEKALK